MGAGPIGFRTPLALFFLSLGTVVAAWWWLATPVALTRAPIDDAAKLECVSYAPFRNDQTPHDPTLIVSPEQIAEDLKELAKVSKCIRTYSIDNGLDKVPELASRVGLKVLLGVWIGRDRAKNAQLCDIAVSLVKEHPGTVAALIVGSEVLLRGDMTVGDLRETIRSVKPRVDIPVTYADVWEFWLRYREVGGDVDFITAHFLPYWEDVPPRAEHAAAHVDDVRKQVVAAFPGKEILIGETGWPSHGRMRHGALASRVNQARFISEILERARRDNFRVNLFEAYDEPWKRRWEGTVGGYWGLFDGAERKLKYPAGVAINNYPFWKLQMAGGLLLCICIFAVGWFTRKRQVALPPLASWAAVAISASVAGILLGVSADKMLHESYGLGGWLVQGFLLAAAVTAPLLSTHALMSGRPLPAFLEVLGPRKGLTPLFMSNMLGVTLMVTTLIAAQTALSLIFDARWRDFPFATLTMAVVPFWTLAFLNGSKSGERPLSEAVFAGLFALAAIYIVFNEDFENWQAMWTSAIYLLLGSALWRARTPAAA
ncbi:glycoside hydrolase family 17 protein [Bradyrhizobium australiense]|uniref:Endo-1,3-beta-glucanase btgC n=1 Tax=Bradyrhizobium australiense TaxID=2721161 RepID=A0A7Y4GNE3_9BRAD|nr:glycosyl hydrolase family 17 protein [Bradyrhizobium australiense]NOJ38988.1 beta-(1-6) glucans synthase [Bradyrhizobium australiense]